jgi:heptosyltransferase-2
MGIAAAQAIRNWPIGRYAVVAKQLREKYRASIILIGGPMDRALADEMLGQLDFAPIDLVGKTSLRQTAGVLEQCDLYVGNDTGPMHLAAAAGTPVVVVCMHPQGGDPTWKQAPERFGPRGVTSRIVRPAPVPPCTTYCQSGVAHCILNVPVEEVTQAIDSIWTFPKNMGRPVE